MVEVLEINEVIGSILINANFCERVNVLRSDSGTGKSFLFDLLLAGALIQNCSFYNLKFGLIDYNTILNGSLIKEHIIEVCKNKDVILMDDADLYLSRSLIRELLIEFPNLMFIISIKFLHSILGIESFAFYTLEHTPHKLMVKKYA